MICAEKFRKKPVIVEAAQWNPDHNGSQIGGWPRTWKKARYWKVGPVGLDLRIPTLEGEMYAYPGDWIIKGVKGEYYPCKPDVFKVTYEKAGDR